MKKLTAKCYKNENYKNIVIYGDRGKLTEFLADDFWTWGFPPIYEWVSDDVGDLTLTIGLNFTTKEN